MNPIDFIRKLRKQYPPAQDSLCPDSLTLVAIDHTLTTKHVLNIMERAHILNQAYKPDPVEYDKVLQMIKDSASQLDDVFIRAIERGQLGENTY